jgi:Ferritin-like domain
VSLLAGVEVVAVDAYTGILGAATAGNLGAVPEVVAHYGATALDHHRVALGAWNRVLVDAGRPAVTQPPADLTITINEQLGTMTDGAELLEVAFIIERIAAATYLGALHTLVSEPAIRLVGSILSVDRQRMAVLLFADGQYPVPETFASTEFAYVAETA